LKNWAEYAGEYKPVLLVRARPELAETTGSLFLRAMVSPYIPAKIRFKTDFYSMKLFCGSQEVQPIHAGKIAHVVDVQMRFVNATDATYEGFYTYPYDAINDSCGEVRLQLFSEKEPNKVHEKKLNSNTIRIVAADFRPYGEFLAKSRKGTPARQAGGNSAVPLPAAPQSSPTVPASQAAASDAKVQQKCPPPQTRAGIACVGAEAREEYCPKQPAK
jgi:hypothetical protein